MSAADGHTGRPASQPARTLSDGQDWLRERLARRASPFNAIDPAAAAAAIGELAGLDPPAWTSTWRAWAQRFAAAAERAPDRAARREAYWQAYQFSFLGRYPAPLHPLKAACYEQARSYFARATGLDQPAARRVGVPFAGRPGEGREVVFYLARPAGAARSPVVMMWGGIDVWKEETYARGRVLREQGFATLHLDQPGVGESPVLAGPDAERQWTPVLDWVAAQDDLDSSRVAALGLSFGGYWAMKLAYTHRDRLAAAVNWGGGVHYTFQRSWQDRSRHASSYLMDLMAARARIFGGSTFEDYVARCPELSLLDQGLLGRPSAPLLLVNGRDDQQNSIEDLYLALQHGDVKSARVFPGGHMGDGPVMPAVLSWLTERLHATK
jgi:esterase FrsA